MNPFDGSGAITTTALALAFSLYLRQVAMQRLQDFIDRKFDKSRGELVQFNAERFKKANMLRFYGVVQIAIGVIIFALTLRMATSVFEGGAVAGHVRALLNNVSAAGARAFIDATVSFLALVLGTLFVFVHVWVDGKEIFKKTEALQESPSKTATANIQAQIDGVKSSILDLVEAVETKLAELQKAAPAPPVQPAASSDVKKVDAKNG